MHLVQLFLPRTSKQDPRATRTLWADLRSELVERFGGVTIYSQSPAQGLWADPQGNVEEDTIVVVEVQVSALDRNWWREYKRLLARRFQQEEVLLRILPIDIL